MWPWIFSHLLKDMRDEHIDSRHALGILQRVVDWMRRGRGPLTEGLSRIRSPLPRTPS